jgi:hypothetical protein
VIPIPSFFILWFLTIKERILSFSLEIDGSMICDQNILRKHVTDFYHNLLGTTTIKTISLHSNFLGFMYTAYSRTY